MCIQDDWKKKFACAARRKGVPLTGSSRMPSEPILFLRQNSATLRGFFPLRGCDSAARSALQIDFRLWLVALVWASHGPPILGSQIRVIVTYRVFGTCRACVSCASGRIWALDRGGLVFRHNPPTEGSRTRQSATKKPRFGRDSRERCLLMAASSRRHLLFLLRLRGLLGVRVTPRLHATNSPGHLAAPAYLLSSSAAVIKPNPPPTFRCPSRTRPRRSSSPFPIYYNIPLCEFFLAVVSLYNLSFSVFNRTFCQTTPGPPYVAPAAFPNDPQPILSRQ